MANMHIVAGTVRTWPVGKLQISIEHEGVNLGVLAVLPIAALLC